MTKLDQALALLKEAIEEAVTGRKPANDERLTVADYAARWSISTSTVRQAIREKRLPCIRIGRAIRIPANAQIQAPGSSATIAARKALGLK